MISFAKYALSYFLKSNSCKICLLSKVKLALIVTHGTHGMALKKDSPYTPFFEAKSLDIIQSGLMKRLKIKHTTNNNCTPIKDEEGSSLSYQKLIMLFIIISVGMVFAMMVLIYEMLQFRLKSKTTMQIKGLKSKEIATQTGDQ